MPEGTNPLCRPWSQCTRQKQGHGRHGVRIIGEPADLNALPPRDDQGGQSGVVADGRVDPSGGAIGGDRAGVVGDDARVPLAQPVVRLVSGVGGLRRDDGEHAHQLATVEIAFDDAQLEDVVRSGRHLVTTYFSGIVDEHDRVWLGGYPGALRDVLGVTVEEFVPLLPEESALLASGARAAHWSERIARVGADVEVLDTYAAGELAGMPAVTHRRVGTGSATYVSADLGREGTRALLERLAGEIDALAADPLAAGGRLEVIVRGDEATRHVFLVNRTDEEVVVDAGDGLRVAPRGVEVLTLHAVPADAAAVGAGRDRMDA